MNILKNIVRTSYPVIKATIPYNTNKYTHNSTLLNYYSPGERTFEGKYKCASTSMVLGIYLQNKGYPIKYHYFKEDKTGGIKDHLYIRCDDVIIDPTYRQFFTSHSNYNNNYLKYLYCGQPYCFYGTNNEFKNYYSDLQSRHYQEYNYNLRPDTLKYWLYSKEVDLIGPNQLLKKEIETVLETL